MNEERRLKLNILYDVVMIGLFCYYLVQEGKDFLSLKERRIPE